MTTFRDTLRKNLAHVAAVRELRATVRAGDIVRISGLDGEWKVWNYTPGDRLATCVRWVNGKPYQALRDFPVSRFLPVSA